MSILKILGGIGAGVLAAAGLVVAGRTGLGKSEAAEPEANTEPAAGGDVPATETEEETESSETDPADDAADA